MTSQRYTIEAHIAARPDRWITDADKEKLVASLQDIHGLWLLVPAPYKRRFEELLLPAGYVLNEIRTASKGLLFSRFPTSGSDVSNVADLVSVDTNQLMTEIHTLLETIRWAETDNDASSKAA